MRLFAVVALSAIVGVACQNQSTENETFQSTRLSVEIEEVDPSLNLNAYSQTSGFVTKAELWCEDKLKASLEFSADQQSIDLYSSLEDCEIRLTEFSFEGGLYSIGSLFSEGVYEFEQREPNSISIIDKKLVRSVQPIATHKQNKCGSDCEINEVHVSFPHDVLDIKKEVLVNETKLNQLQVSLEEEPAPTCESLSARFIESPDQITPPSLEISLTNCTNTIGTDDLEFGFGPTRLDENGDLPGNINIVNVMDAISGFPIDPIRDGDNYLIYLSFAELEQRLENFEVSTIDILTSDYAVAIRNQAGISGLVYLIDNRCETPRLGL